MRFLYTRIAGISLGMALVSCGACAGTANSRFYILSAIPSSETKQQAAGSEPGVAIGIASIDLPEYTDRPQITSRAGENTLRLAEFDRWAEPLKGNFSRVLAENLSILLSSDRVVVFPKWRATAVDYQVTVEVIRFDGNPGGEATLSARWMILDGTGKNILHMKRTSYVESAGASGYAAVAAAQSRTLAALSRDIASAIEAASRNTPPPPAG